MEEAEARQLSQPPPSNAQGRKPAKINVNIVTRQKFIIPVIKKLVSPTRSNRRQKSEFCDIFLFPFSLVFFAAKYRLKNMIRANLFQTPKS